MCSQWARGLMCWVSQNSYPNPTGWVLLLSPFFNILKKQTQKQEKLTAQSHSCDWTMSIRFQSPFVKPMQGQEGAQACVEE